MKKNKSSVLTTEKQKKSPWLKILMALLILALIVAGGAFYRYQTSDIEGNWTATTLNKEVEKEMKKSLSELDKSGDFDTSKILSKPKTTMSIKDNKVEMIIKVKVNKEDFTNQIMNYYKKEINGSFSKEDLEGLDPETKKTIDELMPSKKEIEDLIDQEMDKTSYDIGGEYDPITGTLSTTAAKGNVNRLLKHVNITYINKRASSSFGAQKGYYYYARSGNSLLLKGEDKMNFKK